MKRNLFDEVARDAQTSIALLADPVMIGDSDVVFEKDEATLQKVCQRWCEEHQDTFRAVAEAWETLSASVITRVSRAGVRGVITAYTSGAESRH